jgi:hypothetical protein
LSTLLLTLLIAFILVVLAIAALSVGWLFSGKSKIRRGACGMDPKKLRDKECGNNVIFVMTQIKKNQKRKKKTSKISHHGFLRQK